MTLSTLEHLYSATQNQNYDLSAKSYDKVKKLTAASELGSPPGPSVERRSILKILKSSSPSSGPSADLWDAAVSLKFSPPSNYNNLA